MDHIKKYKEKSKKSPLSEGSLYLMDKISSLEALLRDSTNKLKCHYTKFAGRHTTAGGAASEVITVKGVKETMHCFVQLESEGGTPVTIKTAVCGADQLTVTFSADPSSDHELQYLVC